MIRFISLLFVLTSLLHPPLALAQTNSEEISDFTSEITLNPDTSISVSETIHYFTSSEKHGIYRYIPQRYTVNGLNLTTQTSAVSVTDRNGQDHPFSTTHESGNLKLKIGDPNRTFHGDRFYIINYRTDHALRRFQDHDELYWDITGEGWQVPLAHTTAIVNSPHATITQVACYSGEFGLNDSLCQTQILSDHQAQITYDQTIAYGQNLTVAIALDQQGSLIHFPTPLQQALQTIQDNLTAILVFFPTIIIFMLWYTKGRDLIFLSDNIFDMDPAKPTKLAPLFHRHRTPLVYQPLTHLTPGEAGTILDEKVDTQDIIAEIIDLARQKYLKIEPTQQTGLIFKSKDYLFTKLRQPAPSLPAHQSYLLEQIFRTGDTVKLSSLKGKFHAAIAKTRDLIYQSASTKKLFTQNPNLTRGKYIAFGVFLLGLAMIIAIQSLQASLFLPFVFTILQVPGVIILGYSMVQKSALGSNFHMQAKGLKRTINLGKWRQQIQEKHLFIEEVLPFAISLGVIHRLTHDMEALNIKPPDYLAPSLIAASGFNTSHFINDFTSQAGSTLTYNPSSSSYSGGSGFSGGFSGGGGGGGGGGSW